MNRHDLQNSDNRAALRIIAMTLLGCLLFVFILMLVVLPSLEQYLMQTKRDMISELSATSWELINGYAAQVEAGELTETQAQERALARLRLMRYGPESKDYFWVNDTNHVMLMHPYRQDLVGQNLKNYEDADGEPIFQAFVNQALEKGKGYVDYMWQWKDDPNRIVPKVSHIRMFEPWGWIVGTGIYVEDVRDRIFGLKLKLGVAFGTVLVVLLMVTGYMVFTTREAERGRCRATQAMNRLDDIIETTSDLVSMSDPDGQVTYMNRAGIDLLGWDCDVDVGTKKIGDVHPKEVLQMLSEVALPHAKEYGIWTGESSVLREDGAVIPVSQVIMGHFDKRHRLEYLSTIMRDVTESRTMEQELLRSKNELEKRVAERTESLEWANNQLKVEVEERKVAERSLRYRADFEKLINTVSAEFINCPIDEIENRMSRALSEVGWFLQVDRCYVVVYSQDRSSIANTYGWSGGGAEEIQAHFEQMDVAHWTWYNEWLLDMGIFRYAPDTFIPDECVRQREALSDAGILTMINVALRREVGLVGFFGVQVKSRDVDWPEDLVMLFKVLGEVFMHAIQREINEGEKVRLEAQLQQAQKMESIGQLAAGIAHEINTPTQFVGDNVRFMSESFEDVVTLIDLLEEQLASGDESGMSVEQVGKLREALEEADWEYIKEETPRAVEQTLDGVKRIAKIVQAMKEFSHPGGEGQQAVDLGRVVENTIVVARNEWKYIADVEEEYATELPLVMCQRDEVSQVVLNLLINACHAIAENHVEGRSERGKVLIRTYREDDYVVIALKDDGPGIPKDVGKRIFDPFYTTKEVGKGTGQGLYIAYDIIVNKHHGDLLYTSEPGQGTTFFIKLPIQEDLTASG